MKKDISTDQLLNESFIKAAKVLMTNYKTPGEFLEFINGALCWVHSQQVNAKDYKDELDCHFNILQIIEGIIIPWQNAGDNELDVIAKGIKEITDGWGADQHQEMASRILRALAAYEDISGMFYPEFMRKYLRGIDTLYEMAIHLNEYERQERKANAA